MKRLSPRARRALVPLLAAGLTATVLPWSPSTTAGALAAGETLSYGFSSEAEATPALLEIFEPTVPIPAEPQLELSFGYSRVEADTGGGSGRASFLWPGDPLGEGAKTVVENIGLPPELAGPIAAQGYPIQVNSNHPAGPEKDSKEQVPGSVQRTSASDGKVTAATGYSSNCGVEQAEGSGSGGGGESPGPGLPDVPGLSALMGSSAAGSGRGDREDAEASLADFGAAITGRQAAPRRQAAADEAGCQVPAALAALVDLDGYVSTSRSVVEKGSVTTTARAALGEVRLLGGIVRISGLTATAVSGTDGTENTASGKARYGTLSIGPAEFGIGPDGIEGGGQQQEIPGLPDQPKAALKQLGITLTVPEPEQQTGDKTASSVVEGLVVEIDTVVLSPVLSQLPIGQLVGPVPFPEEMSPLKNALGAIPGLAPRFVLHLGNAATRVQRAPQLDLPTTPPPTNDPNGGDGDGDTSGSGDGPTSGPGSSTTGTTGTAPTDGGAPTPGDTGGSPPSDGALADAAPTGAGLPPLNSIPGALLVGGIALAAAAGSWLRRIGALALGSGASCPHGLDSGLPDLRKA